MLIFLYLFSSYIAGVAAVEGMLLKLKFLKGKVLHQMYAFFLKNLLNKHIDHLQVI